MQRVCEYHLADDPEIQLMIARAKDNVLRDGYVKQAIDQGTTDEKLHAAYDAMKSQPGFAIEETHAAHILVADEAEANAIIKQLQEGADFATLAKEKSTDPSAKTNGGDLGWANPAGFVKPFAGIGAGLALRSASVGAGAGARLAAFCSFSASSCAFLAFIASRFSAWAFSRASAAAMRSAWTAGSIGALALSFSSALSLAAAAAERRWSNPGSL